MSKTIWMQQGKPTNIDGANRAYACNLSKTVPGIIGRNVAWQVGLALVTQRAEVVSWNIDEFFVPGSLWGSGIGSHFLKQLLAKLETQGATKCIVRFGAQADSVVLPAGQGTMPPNATSYMAMPKTDRWSRAAHTEDINFYKNAGFRETPGGELVYFFS